MQGALLLPMLILWHRSLMFLKHSAALFGTKRYRAVPNVTEGSCVNGVTILALLLLLLEYNVAAAAGLLLFNPDQALPYGGSLRTCPHLTQLTE